MSQGPIKLNNVRAARDAGLLYVSDDSPGITRKTSGSGFAYQDARGRRLRSRLALSRINALAIPPAWTDVWICPSDRGHIQAVGRDARGRKQYRYHDKWREVRDQSKYARLIDFARTLPRIRRAVVKDLRRHGLPRVKVLAAVVRFMEMTFIRVGNDEYARQNQSFGLTTLRDRHVKITRSKVTLEFRGKSGVEHEFEVNHPRLAAIAQKCQDLPGQQLFQYLDEAGKVCDVGSADVNNYLREIAGEDFTAKDFRTWAGTVLAARALAERGTFESHAQAKRGVVKAIEIVAAKLGNTRAVCRKCYIHPDIVEAYMDGALPAKLGASAEATVLALLQRRLAVSRRSRSRQPKSVAEALERSLRLPRADNSTVHRRKAS